MQRRKVGWLVSLSRDLQTLFWKIGPRLSGSVYLPISRCTRASVAGNRALLLVSIQQRMRLRREVHAGQEVLKAFGDGPHIRRFRAVRASAICGSLAVQVSKWLRNSL